MSTNFSPLEEPEVMIQAIRDWIIKKDKTEFDTTFIDSLESQINEGKDLTPNQTGALHRICHAFSIGN